MVQWAMSALLLDSGAVCFRPNKEKTGHVSASGASVVKNGLNPEKGFMQVHYLKVSVSDDCSHQL